MSKANSLIIAIAALFSLGCVSTATYNKRLLEIDSQKKEISSLEDALKHKEAEKAALQAELDKLNKNYAELKGQKDTLAGENANLRSLLQANKEVVASKVADLIAQIADKNNQLNARNIEIDDLKKQIETLSQEKAAAVEAQQKSIAEMKKTYDSLAAEMQGEIKKGEITITRLKNELSLNMVEKILFDSGSAVIKPDGKKILNRVAGILEKVTDRQIRVEGHTDNVPIGPNLVEKFPTNWELSTARATNVVRFLQDDGVDPSLLVACGYSEYRPVASDATEEGRAKNRRIEIVLTAKERELSPAEEPQSAETPSANGGLR